MQISNLDFLKCLFGDSYVYAHVTSFPEDPNDIPAERRGIAWGGGYYKDTYLVPNSNQFYAVSLFSPDECDRSRRRKAHFSATYVIGLDDVREKLDIDQVRRLPPPTVVLKSSLHSEQWLYVLTTPETDQGRVDNLHDGLIANGLAPDGKDPGQKGVTRYLRLPEGVNTKSKRVQENGGVAPRCVVEQWNPFNKVTMEQLAAPFDVDLNAARRGTRVDGAADIPDHPLLQVPDLLHVKEVRSDGRFDITCPWVDSHTDADDSGTAIFTNDDGGMGFKCHHGNCHHRTGKDLLAYLETADPGFGSRYTGWQRARAMHAMIPVSFLTQTVVPIPAPVPDVILATENGVDEMLKALKETVQQSDERRNMCADVLRSIDSLPKIDQMHWHEQILGVMGWNKTDLNGVLKSMRDQWYRAKVVSEDFYDEVFFVKELNQFYDYTNGIFFSVEAFQNSFGDQDAEARKIALQDGRVTKVHKLDYAPNEQKVFEQDGVRYGNTWRDQNVPGREGDVTRWLEHFNALGWGEHRDHVLQWMAYTILKPETKINHMLLMGSGEGCGKDFILYPIMHAMGGNGTVVSGEELLENFNDFILSKKYVHFNEVELGDHKAARMVSNRLKPYAAAPPDTLRVNQKGIKRIDVRNIISAVMTTNSRVPLHVVGASRRFYAMWSDLKTRGSDGNMTPDWMVYWEDRWNWMKSGGADACVWYLRNCVSLDGFNPGAAPPMTDFLREIEDASKSPAVQTLEAFVAARKGAFESDMVTAHDAAATLQCGEMFLPNAMYLDRKRFTPAFVGRIFGEMDSVVQLRGRRYGEQIRCWVVRNTERYTQMSPAQVMDAYNRGKVSDIKEQLKIVK